MALAPFILQASHFHSGTGQVMRAMWKFFWVCSCPGDGWGHRFKGGQGWPGSGRCTEGAAAVAAGCPACCLAAFWMDGERLTGGGICMLACVHALRAFPILECIPSGGGEVVPGGCCAEFLGLAGPSSGVQPKGWQDQWPQSRSVNVVVMAVLLLLHGLSQRWLAPCSMQWSMSQWTPRVSNDLPCPFFFVFLLLWFCVTHELMRSAGGGRARPPVFYPPPSGLRPPQSTE